MSNINADEWGHSAIAVTDVDKAVEFYSKVFGFELKLEIRDSELIEPMAGLPGLRCDIVELKAPYSDHPLEFVAFRNVPEGKEDHAPTKPGMAHIALRVLDLDKALEQIRELGGEVVGEVVTFDQVIGAYVKDPTGTYIEVVTKRTDV
jgi:predicted enzyme related to lactoylglutathione lyase